MLTKHISEQLSQGVKFTSIIDNKFKNNLIVVRFITKLQKDSSSSNALIPNVLITTNDIYRTRTELTTKLSELYGSGLSTINHKIADNQVIGITASCICDEYALNSEKLTSELSDILLGCLFNPLIESDGFEKQHFDLRKQELIDAIDAEINDKRVYAIIQANKTIYKDEPSAITAYGDKEGAKKITPQSAYLAYKKLLKSAYIDIMYVGGNESEEAISKIKKAFSGIDRDYQEQQYKSFSPLKDNVQEVSQSMDVNQCKMVMAFKSGVDNFYANRLMTTMLGGTAFSKFFVNVREKLSLCYYCAAGYVEGKGTLIVDSGVEEKNIKLARKEIINQINALADGDFTDDEIQNAKLNIAGDLKSNYDSTSDLSAWFFIQSVRGDNYTPEQANEALQNVTREDVKKCAAELKLDTVYVMQGREDI